jgi:TRAP-type C4-dicarboxylate transport system substrate-binding protein
VKKLIISLLAIVLISTVIFTGCAEPEPAPAPAPSPAPTPAPTPAPAQTIELRLSHHNAPVSYRHEAFLYWADQVAKATNGVVKITVYPAAQLAGPADVIDKTAAGIVDIGWGMTGVSPGRWSVMDVINLPGLGFRSCEMGTLCLNYLKDNFPELSQQVEKDGVKLLFCDTTAPDAVGTKEKPLRTVEDFAGIKLRAAGPNAIQHLELMGAVPVMMGPGDIYTNVEKGVIDGWNMPWGGVDQFKLNEITNYYHETQNWIGPFFTVMNGDKWNSIPPDVQAQVLSASGMDWLEYQYKLTDEEDARIKEWALSLPGTELIEYPPAERAKMSELAKPIWDKYVEEEEAKGYPGRAILEATLKWIEEYKS